MKKRTVITVTIAAVVLVVLAVLFVPYQTRSLDDGGTKDYCALAYRRVDWKRMTEDGIYEKTRYYFWDDIFRSVDELWAREEPNVEHRFIATVIELTGNTALVEPMEYEWERSSSDRICFGIAGFPDIGAEVGSLVQVTYRGGIRESYPAGIDATGWEMAKNLRYTEYTGPWLDQDTAQPIPEYPRDMTITRIYSNCFFARDIAPHSTEFKINGTLSDAWCVGDDIRVTFKNLFKDENGRMEGDMSTVGQREPDKWGEITYDKPVIYLYPEKEMEVSVCLMLDGRLTCTYPAYQDGWTVTAKPDGTLTDASGQTYSYLYWEGESYAPCDLSKGFCVKGEDTAAFLETALARLGLNRREANEFIVYWLPLMEQNPYNIISFQTDAYTDAAQLEIDPAPDTLIRVFMAWQASDSSVELPEQELTAPEREGFTVVEWGGTEIR